MNRTIVALMMAFMLLGCGSEETSTPAPTEDAGSSGADTSAPVEDTVASVDSAGGDAPAPVDVPATEDVGAEDVGAEDAGGTDSDTTGVQVIDLAAAEAMYATYCALCHGPVGEGYAADGASALNNQSWLTTATDALIRNAIIAGRPGTSMSAWSSERGGPLSALEIEALVKLIRGWQTETTIALPDTPVVGVAARAEPIYEFECASCHGAAGVGQPYLGLANPELLANASDAFLRYAIAKGRPGTPMPGYETELTPQGIDDLVTLIRSWQVDPEAPPTVFPNDEAPAVLNDGGPEPALGETLHVPAALVKAALDAGAELVLLDARPGSDYVVEHIAGAISVPFYAVADHLDRLPKDVWIVAYCACPHAESGLAAEALTAAGYDKVRVLDEGFLVWKDLGHPTSVGPEP